MRKEHWKMLLKLVRLLRGGRNGVYLGDLIQAIPGMSPSEDGAGLTLRRVVFMGLEGRACQCWT
jgi:hypothetical protein